MCRDPTAREAGDGSERTTAAARGCAQRVNVDSFDSAVTEVAVAGDDSAAEAEAGSREACHKKERDQ